ncbi:MAG: HEAT repeat domain-containing protein [Planctomycetes bacterium]|nr:HEAT repeat domain-containing protein [Planctomycetota bacterium]
MTPIRFFAPFAALLILTAQAAGAGDAIPWQPSAEGALALAASERRPVFIAVNMDGERANDQMVAVHYQDPVIAKLAQKTVNLFASRFDHGSGEGPCPRCGVIPCARHMEVERAVRGKWVAEAADGTVVAPQHVFLDAAGKVILSVPYQVTVGELEWCFVTAIRKLDPEFPWTLSQKARAPRRLVMEGVAEEEAAAQPLPPDKKELAEIFERLRTTGRGEVDRGTIEDVSRLLLSEDKKAIEYVQSWMNSRFLGGNRPGRLTEVIHAIGRTSPPVWWEVVEPFLGDHRIEVRREAAVALEQLAEPKSLGALTKQWKKEKEVDAQKELIRAIAAVGCAEQKAIKLATDQARKADEQVLRVNALIGCAALEDRETVLPLLRDSLADEGGGVRAAAAYVIAVRREEELKKLLEDTALMEADAAVKEALERALEVLGGGREERLRPILAKFAHSDIPRDRL